LIERVGYTITRYDLNENRCRSCGTTVAGHYDRAPGNWGSRRQPVRISEFEVRAAREYGIAPGPPAVSSIASAPIVSSSQTSILSISSPTSASRSMQAVALSPTVSAPPSTLDKLTADQEAAIVRSAARVLAAASEGRNLELTVADLAGTA